MERDPVIRPVWGSSISPLGNPSAAKVIGRAPVAGIEKRRGDPGLTPKTEGPLIRGVTGAGGVKGAGNVLELGEGETPANGSAAFK
jgi:hypothetical protein